MHKQRPRTQSERRAVTREALIEACVRCLVAEGYAGATVRRISAESGVSAGALQHHFASREALMMAALLHIFEEVAERLAELRATGTEYAARARRIVATLWEFYGGPRYTAAAEILIGTRQDAALHDEVRQCREILGQAYRRMWDELMRDTALGPSGRHLLLQFSIATMRGLALLKLHEADPALVEPQLRWLATLIARAMREGDDFLSDAQSRRRPFAARSANTALV